MSITVEVLVTGWYRLGAVLLVWQIRKRNPDCYIREPHDQYRSSSSTVSVNQEWFL